MRLEGYGPFREPVEYPLGGRGLVLLRGKNLDDPGAESNAAGKSKLAMAGLWALTGEGDERPVMDAKVTDVAFDVSARVRFFVCRCAWLLHLTTIHPLSHTTATT